MGNLRFLLFKGLIISPIFLVCKAFIFPWVVGSKGMNGIFAY